MSWGSKFVQKLAILGYPNADKLNGSDFDWYFENNELAPFLEWFTECIDTSNVVTQRDIAEYNQLESSCDFIYDGNDLEKAIAMLQPTPETTPPKQEVREVSNELEIAQKRLKVKQNQNYKLNRLMTSLNEESNELSLEIEKLNSMVKEKWTECMESGKKLDNVLNQVQTANQHLNSFYVGFYTKKPKSKNIYFLSQIDLSDFQCQEEKHNRLLKTYIKKQFFQGFEKVSADTWNETSHKLQIGKPNLSLVREDSQSDYLYHCLALKRLSDFFPQMKFTEIDFQAEEYQLIACIDRVKKMANFIENGKFPCDSNSIIKLQKEIGNQITPLKGRLDVLRNKTMVKQVNELVDSQTIKTVTGDYALKSVRQKYINSKLDRVLVYLVRQRARCEAFSLLYELELQTHRETHEVVTMLDKMMDEERINLDHTLNTLQQLQVINNYFENQSLDDTCASIYGLLVSKNQSNKNTLFALLNAAKDSKERLEQVKSMEAEMNKYREERTKILENVEENLESVTFQDQTVNKLLGRTKTRLRVPVIGLPNVVDAIKELKNKIGELETQVFTNINERNTKLKMLKNNELLNMERQLFHIFYTDPRKLEQISADFELFSSQPTLLKND